MNSIASISLALLLLVVAAAGQSPYYIVENTFDNSDDCNMTGYYGVTSWVYRSGCQPTSHSSTMYSYGICNGDGTITFGKWCDSTCTKCTYSTFNYTVDQCHGIKSYSCVDTPPSFDNDTVVEVIYNDYECNSNSPIFTYVATYGCIGAPYESFSDSWTCKNLAPYGMTPYFNMWQTNGTCAGPPTTSTADMSCINGGHNRCGFDGTLFDKVKPNW